MGYILVDKIHTLRLCCHKVLPAVYDESLSYLEQLAKLTYKVNECIVSVNALNDNVDYLNDCVITLDNRINDVEKELTDFEAEVRKTFIDIQNDYNAKIDATNKEFIRFKAIITSRINELERVLTQLINDEIEYINELYESFEVEMREYVDSEIQRLIDSIPDLTNIYIVDPTTGELSKVQTVVNNLFTFSAHFAFTCDEYNRLGLTVDELNSIVVNSLPIGMTVYQWLSIAKKVLLTQVDEEIAEEFAYPHGFVRDYLDGSVVWHDRNVDINQSLIAVSGCYSCDELNTLAFTCDEIIAFGITCYEYIMRANSLMVRT